MQGLNTSKNKISTTNLSRSSSRKNSIKNVILPVSKETKKKLYNWLIGMALIKD